MSRRNRHIHIVTRPPVDPALLSPMVQIGQVLIKHDTAWDHDEETGEWRSFRKDRRCIVVTNRGAERARYKAEREAKESAELLADMERIAKEQGLEMPPDVIEALTKTANRNVTIVEPEITDEWNWWTVIFDDDLDWATYTSREASKLDNVYPGDWRKNWTITDEIVSQEAIAGRIAAREAMLEDKRRCEQERQEALRQAYEGDYGELVAKLRAENPWTTVDTSPEADDVYDYKRVVKNLRAELKAKFPHVKFAITYSRNFEIQWYLGPEQAEVAALTKKYLNPHGTGYGEDGPSADWQIFNASPMGRARHAVFGRVDCYPHCWRIDEERLAEDRAELERLRAEHPDYVKGIRYYERLIKLAGKEAAL
jgi:Large polyvalent protein associated domain 29